MATPRRPRPRWSHLLLGLGALIAVVVAGVLLAEQGSGPTARRTHLLESIFEDDRLLIYQPMTPAGNATVERTLQTLRGLGVDRLRLIVSWYYIAPAGDSPSPPAGFPAGDPAAYPPANWAPYDRIDRLAQAAGIGVDFDLSGPGPLWAMHPGAPNGKTSLHYFPSAADFEQFVAAVGRRYDGSYRPSSGPLAAASRPLPRVSYWSVWNEPNQPGWLAPQWLSAAGLNVPVAARLYRGLVDAAFSGLASSGHNTEHDTILIGELAPEGSETTAPFAPMTPLPFLRALYCVDSQYRPLTGLPAVALGCPVHGGRFASAHPGLFQATGFAHHPYSFYVAPNVSLPNPDFAPLADLARLERALDRIFATYGVTRRLPLYLTEYGYETSPPRTVPPLTTLRQQSLYLDEATYMAAQDPRVRAMGQFLLQDSAPDTLYPRNSARYWSTFQTGLEFLGGVPKPALNAYRLPIFLPALRVRRGQPLLVWGMLRPAPNGTAQAARIEWRPEHGSYRPIARVSTHDPSGFLRAEVTVPGDGAVRIAWTSAAGQRFYSRAVGVTVSG